jgi:hypothetical protein
MTARDRRSVPQTRQRSAANFTFLLRSTRRRWTILAIRCYNLYAGR